jgi:hypothetical protein
VSGEVSANKTTLPVLFELSARDEAQRGTEQGITGHRVIFTARYSDGPAHTFIYHQPSSIRIGIPDLLSIRSAKAMFSQPWSSPCSSRRLVYPGSLWNVCRPSASPRIGRQPVSPTLPHYTIDAPCRSLMQHTPLVRVGRTPHDGR